MTFHVYFIALKSNDQITPTHQKIHQQNSRFKLAKTSTAAFLFSSEDYSTSFKFVYIDLTQQLFYFIYLRS